MSQSPQTGQVYFNQKEIQMKEEVIKEKSQSPQTGQVYFNGIDTVYLKLLEDGYVSIPSNGSSLFQ